MTFNQPLYPSHLLTPRTLARSLHVQDMLSVPAISTTIDQ